MLRMATHKAMSNDIISEYFNVSQEKKDWKYQESASLLFSRRSNMGFTARSVRAKQIHKVMKTWIYAPINSRILFFNNGMIFIGCPLVCGKCFCSADFMRKKGKVWGAGCFFELSDGLKGSTAGTHIG